MSVLTRLPIELAEMSVFVSMYVSIFIYKSPLQAMTVSQNLHVFYGCLCFREVGTYVPLSWLDMLALILEQFLCCCIVCYGFSTEADAD